MSRGTSASAIILLLWISKTITSSTKIRKLSGSCDELSILALLIVYVNEVVTSESNHIDVWYWR
jgi:hypothetical protein